MDLDKDDLKSLTASSSGKSAGDSVKSISGNGTPIKEPSNKRNKRTFPTELTISEMPADGDESEKRSYEYEVLKESHIKLLAERHDYQVKMEELNVENEELKEKHTKLLAEHHDYQVKMEELSAENEALKFKLAEKETNTSASEQCEEKSDSIRLPATGPFAFARCFYRRKRGTKFEYVICVFRLCSDVLCDLFQFATRRQLSSLERIGRQFHYVIANRFAEKPFLSLSVRIIFSEPVYCDGDNFRSSERFPLILSEPGVSAPRETINYDSKVSGLLIIGKNEKWTALFLHNAKFSNLPPYLRFENVEIGDGNGDGGSALFEEQQIQLITPLVLQLKPAFVGSKFEVNFPDHSKPLDHSVPIENLDKFLPLFDCCGHYNFQIDCRQNEGSDYLTSILQLLSFGSSVYVELYDVDFFYNMHETTLPIEAISNWLHKPAAENAVKSIKQKREEKRHLHIDYDCKNFGNMLEMVEHLKEAFSTAQEPVQPFYFCLTLNVSVPESIVNEKILNEVSCEELSIHREENEVIIERKRIQTKKDSCKKRTN